MKTVLIVDDEESIRDYLAYCLRSLGINSIEANDGNKVHTILNSTRIDLMIIDIIMPECEGLETIIEVRRQFSNLPIIAMSGSQFNDNYLTMAEYFGANTILHKPIIKQILIRKLAELGI